MKGIIEKQIDEKIRGFHFGTSMLLMLEEDRGVTITQLNQRMKDRMVTTVVDIFHCAAVSYCKLNKIDVDFDRDDIPQWIDQLGGFTSAMKIFNDAMNEEEGDKKNSVALAMNQG